MRYRNAEPTTDDRHLERLKRKRDQAWDMAGNARTDRDTEAEKKYTAEAQDYCRQIKEYLA